MPRELPLEISLAAGADQEWPAELFTTSSDMFPRGAIGCVVSIGCWAGWADSVLFAFFAGHILQLAHGYASLFCMAAVSYIRALGIVVLLMPARRPLEMAA